MDIVKYLRQSASVSDDDDFIVMMGAGRCTEAADEIERLREALRFYAHRPNYAARSGFDSFILRDNFGDKARAALEGYDAAPHDPTNPFAPRDKPQNSSRLMTDAKRRASGLDPNGGFDGPTGAD